MNASRIFTYFFIFMLSACSVDNATLSIVGQQEKVLDAGSCHHLSSNNEGMPLLTYVIEDSSDSKRNIIAIAEWNIETGEFNTPQQVEVTKGVQAHEEGMPKAAYKKNGDLILMYSIANPSEEHKYAAIIYYTMRMAGSDKWSQPEQLVKDTASYSQRFFDLALNKEGELSACWLDSRKKEDEKGSTLYYAETVQGKGFSTEKAIAFSTCECCRTKLYIDEKRINIVFRDIINDTIRDMSYVYSHDNGKTFTEPVRISNDNWVLNGCPHTGPDMLHAEGNLHFTWYTQGGEEGVYHCTSTNGKVFTERRLVNSSGRHPQIFNLSKNVFVVYENLKRTENGIERPIVIWSRNNPDTLLYVSQPKVKANFPVAHPLQENYVLVVWNETSNGKSDLKYKVMSL